MEVDIETLKKIPLLSGLSSAELASIKSYFRLKRIKKGEVFHVQGEHEDNLYILLEGIVKVYRTSYSGDEQIWNIYTPITPLNIFGFFSGQHNNYLNMKSLKTGLLCVIKNNMNIIFEKYPLVALNTIEALSKRGCEILEINENLERTIYRRLVRYILTQSEKGYTNISLSQQDLANIFSVSRASINKALGNIQKRGAIKLRRGSIEITQPKLLEDLNYPLNYPY